MMTVLGAAGFIGSHLVRQLEAEGISCYAPARDEDIAAKHLGHVIYCIGLTADFRTRPSETVEAHVCKTLRVVRECNFESFVYLSSTRLYKGHSHDLAREDDDLRVNPLEARDLYNISKLMGESLALLCGEKARIVRLSNLYGDDFTQQTFLSMIISEALLEGRIRLHTSLESAKDYVSVNDVVALLPRIALGGRQRSYNVASGVNVSNKELVTAIARLTCCQVTVEPDASASIFPKIDVSRIQQEFDFTPSSIVYDLPRLIDSYRRYWSKKVDHN